ncbi:MAG: hypothetical protein WC216_11570 [Gallionella sp.]|jgi:23S rRNA C2498 (ribose-2'-O)-methylase RlmM
MIFCGTRRCIAEGSIESDPIAFRARLDMEGISYKMIAKQLCHDREEITVFLSKTRNR